MPRCSKWFLPSGFLTKILRATLLSLIHAACPAHLSLLDLINVCRETPKIWCVKFRACHAKRGVVEGLRRLSEQL
jgi:hypothetical protein